MDQTILERLNASVKANDILYFLGDFCIGSKVRALEHRKQIRCRKIFAVPGNHDKQIRKLTEEFSWLSNLAEISIHGQPIVICHYALRVWNRSHHGAWHLYGHSHGNLSDTPTSLSMDVGVDTHDFRPWHFDEISPLMAERVKRPHRSISRSQAFTIEPCSPAQQVYAYCVGSYANCAKYRVDSLTDMVRGQPTSNNIFGIGLTNTNF